MEYKMTNQTSESKPAKQTWYTPKNASHGKQQNGVIPVQFLLDPRVQNEGGRTGAIKVFVALSTLANARTGLVGSFNEATKTYYTYSLETIGKIAGLVHTNVSRALAALKKLGWADVEYIHGKTLVIHLKFPDADLEVLKDNGKFVYQNEPLTKEEAEAHKERVKARLAKHDKYTVKPEDNFPTMTDEECAKEEAERAVAIAEMRKQDSAEKSKRVYKNEAIRDVAMFIATGSRTYSDADVAKFYLSYSMTEEEFKVAAESFEHCYEDIFKNVLTSGMA
jgi:hypothetical protein